MDLKEKSLKYHQTEPAGKIATFLTKPLDSQDDLTLAYSPGVAFPCNAIKANPEQAYQYTGKGNLVGVISNGSAVLGLGNIGPQASKPVMEGKAMLFKKFANIDVFDIEVQADSPEDFIRVVKSLEPTFGGINLEDIKAPECFYIEEQLRKLMNIPVFHDDQHGTAIIAGSAFINALELTGRDIALTKVVFSGAGAAAIACAQLFLDLGIKSENLILCDSKGVIFKGRKDGMNPYKARFAGETPHRDLAAAISGADAFVGVSTKGVLTPKMVKTMAPNPIIFALANPDPEILPTEALEARPDAIIATGRSDFPNQVNNVLGFPFIFRGALDVRATEINEDMKRAAVHAIAELAKEDVPDEVMKIYSRTQPYCFGKDYLIPKPVDPRVLLKVAPAVARAAMASGVARQKVDLEEYIENIERILGPTKQIMRKIRNNIKILSRKNRRKPSIVIPHGHDERMIKVAAQMHSEAEIDLILLGSKTHITQSAEKLGIQDIDRKVTIINPLKDYNFESFSQDLFELRCRKGVSKTMASEYMRRPNYYGAMMVRKGLADGMVTGLVEPYRDAIKPVLEIIGPKQDTVLSGVKILVFQNDIYFVADCTINIDPTPEQIADIAQVTAEVAKSFTSDPIRVGLLSFSSYGSNRHPRAAKMAKATAILRQRKPEFLFDGEIQADVATNPSLQKLEFPFTKLDGKANVLICPNLESANISYKLLDNIGNASCIGPILLGTAKSVSILERGAALNEIEQIIYITASQALKQLGSNA